MQGQKYPTLSSVNIVLQSIFEWFSFENSLIRSMTIYLLLLFLFKKLTAIMKFISLGTKLKKNLK